MGRVTKAELEEENEILKAELKKAVAIQVITTYAIDDMVNTCQRLKAKLEEKCGE